MSLWMHQLALQEQHMLMLGRACAQCDPDLPRLIQSIERAHAALEVLAQKHDAGELDDEQITLTTMWLSLAETQVDRLAAHAGVRRMVLEAACSFLCSHHEDDLDAWMTTYYEVTEGLIGPTDPSTRPHP